MPSGSSFEPLNSHDPVHHTNPKPAMAVPASARLFGVINRRCEKVMRGRLLVGMLWLARAMGEKSVRAGCRVWRDDERTCQAVDAGSVVFPFGTTQ